MDREIVRTVSSESVLKNIIEILTGIVGLIPEIDELENMSTTELYIFLFTAVSKSASNSMLSKQLNISKSAVSIATKSLLGRGLIDSKQSKEDRRQSFLILTKYGEEIYRKLLKAFEEILREVYRSIDKEGTDRLEDAFEVLVNFAKLCKRIKESKHG